MRILNNRQLEFFLNPGFCQALHFLLIKIVSKKKFVIGSLVFNVALNLKLTLHLFLIRR